MNGPFVLAGCISDYSAILRYGDITMYFSMVSTGKVVPGALHVKAL